MDEIATLLELQHGVISRRQVLESGLTRTFVARKLRRREWVQVHPGVYVHHNGPLTWHQRAWAAVLVCWPAALDGRSAVRAHEGPGRRAAPSAGPISSGTQELAGELDAIAVLADACGGRRTTAERLQMQLSSMSRVRRRKWLGAILRDVADGTCSVLEHGYLTRVERPHGLPRGLRQVAATSESGRRMFRDVWYGGDRPPWRQIVELDGRLHHGTARARDADLERDLDAALEREHTVRLGYGQVFGRACGTASKVGRLLQLRGWTGQATPCPRCAAGEDRRGSDQAG